MTKATTKPKKQKTVKVVNAKELKAWLRGIQEFQPDGWVPSVEQWDAIRERIFLLEETEYQTVEYAQQSYNHQHVVYEEARPIPQQAFLPVHRGPSNLNPSVEASAPTSGGIATSRSPTETGVVSLTSANEVIEAGEQKSMFS